MTPPDFQRRLNEARRLLLAKNFGQALPRYEELARQCPQEAVVWLEYGNAASGLRRRSLADQAWQKALDLAPRNAELIGLIGHQYQGLRNAERARACFVRAAAAEPRAVNPRISLAVLLEQQHRLEEARAAVDECLAIDSRDDQARYFSALLDRRENRLEASERKLRDLIASAPKHPYVRYACRYELAQILDRTDRFDEAMQQFKRAVTLDANDAGARTNRAQTNLLHGEFEHGWREYEWRWRRFGATRCAPR